MRKKSRVPTAVKNRVVDGGKPVSRGTRNVAPNIATTCWAPMPIVRGHERRSPGRTTSPGWMEVPSPWVRHVKMLDFCALMSELSPIR